MSAPAELGTPQGLEIGESYCENTKKPATSNFSHDPNVQSSFSFSKLTFQGTINLCKVIFDQTLPSSLIHYYLQETTYTKIVVMLNSRF